jgi:hypothetical protein
MVRVRLYANAAQRGSARPSCIKPLSRARWCSYLARALWRGGNGRCSRNARCKRCAPARRKSESGSRSNPCRSTMILGNRRWCTLSIPGRAERRQQHGSRASSATSSRTGARSKSPAHPRNKGPTMVDVSAFMPILEAHILQIAPERNIQFHASRICVSKSE